MLIENKYYVTVPIRVIVRKLEDIAGSYFGYERSFFVILIRGLETNEVGVVNPGGLFFAMHSATDSLARTSQDAMRRKIYSILSALRDEETEELINETQKIALACGLCVMAKTMSAGVSHGGETIN